MPTKKKKITTPVDEALLAKRINDYITGRDGRELVAKYGLDCEKTWEVLGEDNSCGGPFDQPQVPQLGLFRGKLSEVIAIAVMEPRWFSWGGGGKIRPYHAPKRLRIRKV
jgi:hypothetical protein